MQKTPWLLTLALATAGGCQAESQNVDALEANLSAAPIDLIAIGSLSGTARDLSTETAGALENGVPGNLLGGLLHWTLWQLRPILSSADPDNARLDPESIRVSDDSKEVFLSDEYGPYVYQSDQYDALSRCGRDAQRPRHRE
ncbi:MAG TPA: hypothetical protein VHZ95_12020 [Polyangiales bacterium]|nr:hypothetical protein [Polyangiales bacterium]